MKLQAVLFDLDNTLIHFSEAEFHKKYIASLYLSFCDITNVEKFSKSLMQSTKKMLLNNGKQSNVEYFIEDFAKNFNTSTGELWQRFADFYNTKYHHFESLMKPTPGVYEIIKNIQNRGLKIAIATNPVFPANVQSMRLKWAGLDASNFDLVTDAENSTFCKPSLEYYYQICEKIDTPPEACLMVGNDLHNDIIATKTGMKTFLTTDHEKSSLDISRELIEKANQKLPVPDFKGPINDLDKVVIQLIES